MRDIDVRVAVRRMLDESHAGDADTRIVEELGIWAGSVRVDLAVINGEFHGIELKSARDTLERLPRQAELYNEVFDRVTLVVAENHFTKALDLIPDWWGVLTANLSDGSEISLQTVREAAINPNLNPVQVARLFWRSEAIALLTKYGVARGYKSKPADIVAHKLADALPIQTLRLEARTALKLRERLGQSIANV